MAPLPRHILHFLEPVELLRNRDYVPTDNLMDRDQLTKKAEDWRRERDIPRSPEITKQPTRHVKKHPREHW